MGMRRSSANDAELIAAGIKPVVADVTKPSDLAQLPGPFDWVVNCVSSTRGGVDEYRQVYLQGTRNLIEWLASAPPKKFVYTSSTSVYGQNDGNPVKEGAMTAPVSDTSKVLVETEKVLTGAAMLKKFPAVILRVGGIYGPDRGQLFQQYLKDEARLDGKGERILNMVHRDDVAGAIVSALKNGQPGNVYNIVDDEPVSQANFFRWLAEALGKWMPPSAPEDPAADRKRGVTNKKVQNRRARMELGWQLKYPTFRQGYTTEMVRLERAGQLDIKPDPR
jgi:nucleoside-diphosphate-sugar epimerase